MNGRPFVSFVGAGPGDPELVTLKALRRLREAEVVIHDRLIPGSLLSEAPAAAEIIDAGKAPGHHCMGQSQINWLLVDRAPTSWHAALVWPVLTARLAGRRAPH